LTTIHLSYTPLFRTKSRIPYDSSLQHPLDRSACARRLPGAAPARSRGRRNVPVDRQRRERGIYRQSREGASAVSAIRETFGGNQRVNEIVPKSSHAAQSEQHDAVCSNRPGQPLRCLATTHDGSPRRTGRAEKATPRGSKRV